MAVIKLRDIADAMDAAFQDWEQYINIRTGEIESIPEDAFFYEGDEDIDDLIDRIEAADSDYYRIPDQKELDEYSIMRAFAEKCSEPDVNAELKAALGRSHPYRRFKDSIGYFGISENYYAFRYSVFLDKARDWCELNGIEYEYEPDSE